ncbi:choice-of-anchor K domain-containing protein [Poriferisphaera corsica]|uniref:choice-of-anchor K domain-containing protein n=1 Tax=Poriferisphaera corsica TaxID=2528020 RepID=UPI0011A8E1C9|nr:choice-of-anchor K domain-containing protein [Poriferisphaera corsica]
MFISAMPCSKLIAATVPVTRSGYTNSYFNVPDEQPENAIWSEAPHTGVGEILYTGRPNNWYSPPTVVRINGSYIRPGTELTDPFKAAKFYFYAGNIEDGSMIESFETAITIPGIAETFTFDFQLQDNSDGTQAVLIADDIAEQIVSIDGIEYQLQMLGFKTNGPDIYSLSLITNNNRVMTSNLHFQLIPATVPLPATGSMAISALALLFLKRRRS